LYKKMKKYGLLTKPGLGSGVIDYGATRPGGEGFRSAYTEP
jgi:hypothetical protein